MSRFMGGILASLDFQLPCFTQIHGTYCGPAVIQMLLSVLGIDVTQPMVADAGGAMDCIERCGMRVDQLARAVYFLAPQTQFWIKNRATLDDLTALVGRRGCPVGVEWQGQAQPVSGRSPDADGGHYSVVSRVDALQRKLVIADPFLHHLSRARIFTFEEFESRWWDYNEIPDPFTGQTRLVEDDQTMFIVTSAAEAFPLGLGMLLGGIV